MTDMRPRAVVGKLRAEIARLESQDRRTHAALPFGLRDVDTRLPGGGLARGALHEIAGGGAAVVHGSAAALFAAGIVARLDGWVLWCLTKPDLFAPATFQAGLDPDRVIYVEAGGRPGRPWGCLRECGPARSLRRPRRACPGGSSRWRVRGRRADWDR
jgi:protein ImuA